MSDFSSLVSGSAASALGAAGPAMAVQAGSGLISGLIGGLFQKKAQKRQFEYQQSLMQQQHDYELENLAAQDQYQRDLVLDSNSMLKKSLQKAGYSTADPNGTGVTPATVSPPSTSASGSAGSFPVNSTPSFSFSDLVNAENVASQTRLNDIESKYRAKLLEGQIGKYNMDIQVMREKLPEEVGLLQQTIRNKQAELKLTDKEIENLDANIKQLMASTEGIKIDNKYKDNLNDATVRKLQTEAANLAKDGRIKEVQALLADHGILVGADWFTQLAAISAMGHSEDIMMSLENLVQRVAASLPSVASGIFGAASDGVVGTVKSFGSRFKDRIENFLDKENGKRDSIEYKRQGKL